MTIETKGIRNALQGVTLVILSIVLTGFVFTNNQSHSPEQNEGNALAASSENIESLVATDDRRSEFVEDGDTLVVKSTGTDLSYDITEIRAKAGSTITIRYDNSSDMPHNIVFVNGRDDIQPVGVAGIQSRDTGYVPMDDANQERIFAFTDLARPGEVVDVTFTVPDPGTYPYICTYPGHFTMMQGDLISEE